MYLVARKVDKSKGCSAGIRTLVNLASCSCRDWRFGGRRNQIADDLGKRWLLAFGGWSNSRLSWNCLVVINGYGREEGALR